VRNQRIGIVTVTYNSGAVLPDFLHCVFAQTHTDFLLVAVDNSSVDNTVEVLQQCRDERLIVIANRENLGIAEGDNQGIQRALEAGCSSILLLNNDTVFDRDMFAQLLAGMQKYDCDMVCPKMLYFDQPDRIWAAGGLFQPRLGYRTLHFGEGELDRGQHDQERAVTFAPACCILIRVELFQKIGLMDPRYFVYSDDADFLYRALQVGATLFYLPGIRLLHKVSSLTGGDNSPFTIRYTTRNRAYFKWKHLGWFSAFFWNSLYRVYYLAKFLLLKSTAAELLMRQRALSEARRMPRGA
jgi:GT2 family glycosyltransferase